MPWPWGWGPSSLSLLFLPSVQVQGPQALRRPGHQQLQVDHAGLHRHGNHRGRGRGEPAGGPSRQGHLPRVVRVPGGDTGCPGEGGATPAPWWHAGDARTLSAGGHAPPVAGGQPAGQRALRRLRPRLRQRPEAAGLAVPLVQSHRKDPCPSPPKPSPGAQLRLAVLAPRPPARASVPVPPRSTAPARSSSARGAPWASTRCPSSRRPP